MRTIRLSIQTINRAIAKAQTQSDDWQAECCEILLIPAIAKRWRELNTRFPGVHLVRHDGMPHRGFQPSGNQAIGERDGWAEFAGYCLRYSDTIEGYGWNSVRSNYYAHSPSCAWNGVTRETICRFVESIRAIANGHNWHEDEEMLARVKIVVTGVEGAVPA